MIVDTDPPKKPGRPPLAPEHRLSERVVVYCTKEQRKKVARLGGIQWLRERIDLARIG